MFHFCRCFCAAKVNLDNDTSRFNFHGTPHLWDGRAIRRNIKGNSTLYVLEDDQVCLNYVTLPLYLASTRAMIGQFQQFYGHSTLQPASRALNIKRFPFSVVRVMISILLTPFHWLRDTGPCHFGPSTLACAVYRVVKGLCVTRDLSKN